MKKKNPLFCKNVLIYTINKTYMVQEIIISKFSCNLKIMSRYSFLEPQPDSALYIILKDGILRFTSFNITSKQGIYFTLSGVYRLIVHETYEGIISFMTIYSPYQDSTWDIRSNITLRLQEFSRALPSGTPSGEGVYWTLYPSSRPYMDTIY